MVILLRERTVHTRYCWTNDSFATTVIFVIVCEKVPDSGRASAIIKNVSLFFSLTHNLAQKLFILIKWIFSDTYSVLNQYHLILSYFTCLFYILICVQTPFKNQYRRYFWCYVWCFRVISLAVDTLKPINKNLKEKLSLALSFFFSPI